MSTPERVVRGRFLFDDSNGGVWRIAVDLGPGRVAFVSVPDGAGTLKGLSRIECRVLEMPERATSRLTILHPDGHLLFEKEIYVPEETWRGEGSGPRAPLAG
jgi:hypothetical protein